MGIRIINQIIRIQKRDKISALIKRGHFKSCKVNAKWSWKQTPQSQIIVESDGKRNLIKLQAIKQTATQEVAESSCKPERCKYWVRGELGPFFHPEYK